MTAAPVVATGRVVARTRRLTRTFDGLDALREVDLDIPGGIIGLVGPNGAGKSTLMALLLGLDHPTSGTVEVLGADPRLAGPALRARIGYAPELDPMPPDVRAQDLVKLVGRLHGLDARTATERAADVLQRLGLGEERFRPIGTLSTGQRQRVKLAQAIVHDPALVLLDEPTDGLDPLQRSEMLALIASLAQELSLDVLVSSHLLADLEQVCSRLVVLQDGRVAGHVDVGAEQVEGRLLVETVRPAEEVVGRLVALGATAGLTGPTTFVIDGDASVLPLLRDVLAQTGAGLRSMGRSRTTLEQQVVQELGG